MRARKGPRAALKARALHQLRMLILHAIPTTARNLSSTEESKFASTESLESIPLRSSTKFRTGIEAETLPFAVVTGTAGRGKASGSSAGPNRLMRQANQDRSKK
jgi:hypothetical protein